MVIPSTINNISATAAVGGHEHLYGFLSGVVPHAYCVLDVDGIFCSLYARKMLATVWCSQRQTYLLSKTPTRRPTVTQ